MGGKGYKAVRSVSGQDTLPPRYSFIPHCIKQQNILWMPKVNDICSEISFKIFRFYYMNVCLDVFYLPCAWSDPRVQKKVSDPPETGDVGSY